MNWLLVTLPLVALTVASATIPRLVPAVRELRIALHVDQTRTNGRGHLRG